MRSKKVLLMGKNASGKTSMRSVIFADLLAADTLHLGATLDVEHAHVRFLGNMVLNIWDCGGQDNFMENYLLSQRNHIFKNVQVLIYVFDVDNTEEKDEQYFVSCKNAIQEFSSDAKIFVLIHKMDLIKKEDREHVLKNWKTKVSKLAAPFDVISFGTSIWEETLFKAWSSIVHGIVPNIKLLESHLSNFCEITDAEEVVLFEKATFLKISFAARDIESRDAQRHETISNIVKQFKLSGTSAPSNFKRMEFRSNTYSAFIEEFTDSTYVLVVVMDPSITSSAVLLNIRNAKAIFESLTSGKESNPVSEIY